jgi:transglycosylase-like protein with SLT domain
MSRHGDLSLRMLPLLAILATIAGSRFSSAESGTTASLQQAGGALDRIAYAVDGAESSHGGDPRMWLAAADGPQGPMQVTAAAAADAGGGDRFDETENRALGRAYLARMYRRYGSWPDAIAAYNWGPGHLDEWIIGGRPVDKFPAAVERYRSRVLVTSGLSAAGGADNARLSRLQRLRLLAKQEFAERLRARRRPDAVQLLYTEIMRSTAPGAP